MPKKIIFIIFISYILGCSADALQADHPAVEARKSKIFYERAVSGYQKLLAGRNNNGLRLELAELYFEHGKYPEVLNTLEGIDTLEAKKLRAYTFFNLGDYTQALTIFERLGKLSDDRYLYYYGLTAQKQNLYEQALEFLSLIKGDEYRELAAKRLLAIAGASDGSVEDIRKQALGITQEKYPLAGAVIMLADEKFQLTEENTLISDEHFIVKILNERGKKDFSEVDIGYDSTYEKVEIIYARTITSSGAVVPIGEKDIRDVSRYMNFPLYSNARARLISMPEVTSGAVIEYKVRITQNQLINKKDFDANYFLEESEPILSARFSVSIPLVRDLKIRVLNSEYKPKHINLEPKYSQSKDTKTYLWEFKDIPHIELENSMPPKAEITPVIQVSTFSSWEDIYKWWRELASDRQVANEAIKRKTEELTSGLSGPEAKIRAIYNYCAQDIRYVGIEYGQAGYKPHAAVDIFKNKYGDCKDKAILFVTMLKVSGIEAYPVLIGTRGVPETSPDFPAVNFNHCIALVELEGKKIFLDITAETCSFGDLPGGDQARQVLIFKPNNYEIFEIPLFLPAANTIAHKSHVLLHADETVFIKKEVATLGAPDQAQRYWLRYTPPNLIEASLKEKIQDITASGTLIKYNYENAQDLNKPIKLSYEYDGKNFLKKAGKARIMPQFGSLDTSLAAKDSRRYPLALGNPYMDESFFEIELPAGMEVKYLPENININSRWLDYLVNYQLKGKKLMVWQKEVLKLREVSQSQYAEFKKFIEDSAISLRQNVILEKK